MSSKNIPTGKQIKAARMLLDMTQEELAEVAGVSKSTVENYETGRKRPIFATASRIVDALGRRGVCFTMSSGSASAASVTYDPTKAREG